MADTLRDAHSAAIGSVARSARDGVVGLRDEQARGRQELAVERDARQRD